MEYLRPGDTVDIIAPASPSAKEDLEKVKLLLASWQLQASIPADLFGEDLFCANTDDIRFKHLSDALTNTTSKAVWCLRGGYGSLKLIPALMRMQKPSHSKIFIGSSDITALHIFLQNHWGWSTIHGPSALTASIEKVDPQSLLRLKNLCFCAPAELSLYDMKPLNLLAEKNLTLHAPITGGNLCIIQTSLGTPWQIDTRNKILFIEEVNERAYRVDRMLEHLKQANIIQPAKAILFGDFIGGKETDGSSKIEETLQKFANTCSQPVLQIKGIGHDFVNDPLILGKSIALALGKNPHLLMQLF